MIIVSGGITNTGVSDGTNTYSRGCASFKKVGNENFGTMIQGYHGFSNNGTTYRYKIDWGNKKVSIITSGAPFYGYLFNTTACYVGINRGTYDEPPEISIIYIPE